MQLLGEVVNSIDCDVGAVACAVVADEPGIDVISTR